MDYLSGGEINFWKEMIKKYLVPLEMSDKEKRDQKHGLEEYRDTLVFSMVFFNVLYITAITILQTQASVFLPWTWISDYLGDTAGQDGVYHTIAFVASEVECMKIIKSSSSPSLPGGGTEPHGEDQQVEPGAGHARPRLPRQLQPHYYRPDHRHVLPPVANRWASFFQAK